MIYMVMVEFVEVMMVSTEEVDHETIVSVMVVFGIKDSLESGFATV